MSRQKTAEQPFQVVRFFNRQAEFFRESFQILFGGLLPVKAKLVIESIVITSQFFDELIVVLGLSHPLARAFFHTGPCP
jgi:hypothetical protein